MQPNYTALAANLTNLKEQFDDQNLYLEYYQLVYSASIVILMQLGFTFLEVGSVRVGFTKSILMKNMVDVIISALVYFFIGFAFAFGDGRKTGGVIGFSHFMTIDSKESADLHTSTAGWVYHWSYCATAATVLAGAVAERTQLTAYIVYSVVGSSLLYPVITQWIWSPTGWASKANPNKAIYGVLDNAGGICVHVCAGMNSLIACYFVGPRQHRLNKQGKFVKDLPKQNQAFIVFGMLVLWFSWYAFNAGPAILKAASEPGLIGQTAVYTTVCAASSGTTFLLLSALISRKLPEPCDLSNGILAGLVSSTSGCACTQPYYGLLIGSVGALVTFYMIRAARHLQIDDVVDAIAVHLGCGTWSAISAPIFSDTAAGPEAEYQFCGIMSGCRDGWKQLGVNVLLTLLTMLYVSLTTTAVCIILRKLKILRIKVESEKKGVDYVDFEGSAYNHRFKATSSTKVKLSTKLSSPAPVFERAETA